MMKRFAAALAALIVMAPAASMAQSAIVPPGADGLMAACSDMIDAWALKMAGRTPTPEESAQFRQVFQEFAVKAMNIPTSDIPKVQATLDNAPPIDSSMVIEVPIYRCIARARLTQLRAEVAAAAAPSAPADEPPLGLKNVPPEAFKKVEEPERHWLKAFMRTDGQMCDLEGCSHPFVEVHLTIDDPYGARTFDWSITRSDTHVFNYPAEAGRSYRFEVIHHPDEKFNCGETGAASGVIDDRFATNADLAQPMFGVTCTMNGAGLEEYNRIKAEKAASDALLQKG